MMDPYTEALCRVYSITCPACGNENRFPRLRPDIIRTPDKEIDGHPLAIKWMAEGDFPEWLSPLNFFWGVCETCRYAGQLDDADFRQWEKNSRKFLGQYIESSLDTIARGGGVLGKLGEGIQDNDPFGSALAQFHIGIFTEGLKQSPVAGNLARFYLRIAWLYRDEMRLFGDFAPSSKIKDILAGAAEAWKAKLPENNAYPMPPGVATDEVSALRFTLAYFEWNFISLTSAKNEDEMRLTELIAEVGYRVYQLTSDEADFKKSQNLFSGSMGKALAVINDKTIVGGAVNKAKDFLEKAGDRGRELRALKDRRDKGEDLPTEAVAPSPPKKKIEKATPAPKETKEVEAKPAEEPQPAPATTAADGSSVEALQRKVEQLDVENKRWMRLAGMSSVTGLPNRVMIHRVLLPGALKQAMAKNQPIGCIIISPENMQEVNGKYGRTKGDQLLQKVSECIKDLLKRDERLSHPDGVNFMIIVSGMPLRQLKKRAESLHKEVTSRRFALDGETLSVKVSIGVAGFEGPKGASKSQIESLYSQAFAALDTAKANGSTVEMVDQVTAT